MDIEREGRRCMPFGPFRYYYEIARGKTHIVASGRKSILAGL
jgi:hypothetical protein